MQLTYPLQGKSLDITSNQGKRWGREHKGVDLSADSGTRVLSVLDGIVEKSGDFNDGYGGQVLIKHPTKEKNYYSRYAHLRKWYVKPGERVNAGEKIGESGGGESDAHKGRSTGPHLHFEFLGEGLRPLNAEAFLAGGAVGAAAVASSDGDEDQNNKKVEKTNTQPNIVDKIMYNVAKVMAPIGAATAIKGASTPKKESVEDKSLLEEISRIKELLR